MPRHPLPPGRAARKHHCRIRKTTRARAERPSDGGSGVGGVQGRCGDNFVTGSEECEPPNTAVCSSSCTIIAPGPGGECDPCPSCPDPADPGCPPPAECEPCPAPTDCPAPTECPPVPEPGCGNGIVEGDEECEPPSEGACSPDCKIGTLRMLCPL